MANKPTVQSLTDEVDKIKKHIFDVAVRSAKMKLDAELTKIFNSKFLFSSPVWGVEIEFKNPKLSSSILKYDEVNVTIKHSACGDLSIRKLHLTSDDNYGARRTLRALSRSSIKNLSVSYL